MTARAQVLDVDVRLDGWKAIADARGCDVRTAMRRYDRVVRRTKGRVWVMRSRLPIEAAPLVDAQALDAAVVRAREAAAELVASVADLEALLERARRSAG